MTGKRLSVITLCLAGMVATMVEADEVSLSSDLMPLFARSCIGCHQRKGGNPEAIKSGIYFEKKQDVLKGVGSLIVPGKPEDSFLLLLLNKPEGKPKWIKTMPPPRSKTPRMSKEEIQRISDWIKAGAKDN